MNLLSSSRTYLPDGTSERVFLGALSLLLLGIGCGLPADETAGPTASQPLEAAASQIDDGVPRARLLLPSFSTGPLPTVGPRMYCRWDASDCWAISGRTPGPCGLESMLVETLPTYTDEDVGARTLLRDNLPLRRENDPTAWIPLGPDVRAPRWSSRASAFCLCCSRAVGHDGAGVRKSRKRDRNYESFLVTSEFPNPELGVCFPVATTTGSRSLET
ncbi:MAG: hypothetical protein H6682_16740 [Candidatus Eisenbacteria bacterium]|nr:hypothetical protein [Candidatus Eisenbacteria bacterium]